MDDVQVATALASCHNLKKLVLYFAREGCVFGRNGMDGLQAMATGCPLLADVSLSLTVDGIHCLGKHLPNLKKCRVYSRFVRNSRVVETRTPNGFPSIGELLTLYPAVKWEYSFYV